MKEHVLEELPEKWLTGIWLFNEQEFFECHDVWEELWSELLGEEHKFIQGMIQASVGMYHFGNENLGGARKLYKSSREKLDAYPDPYLCINTGQFKRDLEHCFEELLMAGNSYPEGVILQDDRIPTIQLAAQD